MIGDEGLQRFYLLSFKTLETLYMYPPKIPRHILKIRYSICLNSKVIIK